LVDAYYRLEDTGNMEKLITVLPENSPILEKLAEKFQSIGLVEAAVQAYVRFGDVKKAIDCCVLLNQWN
jgi:WD repeat-containing protein 35